MIGGTETVSTATALVLMPNRLLAVMVYLPASARSTAETSSVSPLAPLTRPPLARGLPFKNHWYAGAGAPSAATCKTILLPTGAMASDGCESIHGALQTICKPERMASG